ncbi:hypothetical protein DV738_g2315, partial [Chaetothyriales sp. CBS 135597]
MGNETSREVAEDGHDAPSDAEQDGLQEQDNFDLSAIADGIDSGSLDEEDNISPEQLRRPPPIYIDADDNIPDDGQSGSGTDDNDVLKILNGESHIGDQANGAAEVIRTDEVLDEVANDPRAASLVNLPSPVPSPAEADELGQEEVNAEDELEQAVNDGDEAVQGVNGEDEAEQEDSHDEAEKEGNSHDETGQEGDSHDEAEQEVIADDEAISKLPTADAGDESSSSQTSDPDRDLSTNSLDPGPDSHLEPPTHNKSRRESIQIFDHVEIPVEGTAEPDDSEDDMDASDADDSDDSKNRKKKTRKGRLVCQQCAKAFTSQSNFRRHQLVHAPPQFFCPFCETERLFRRRDKAIDHIERHHSPQELKDVKEMAIDITVARANAHTPPSQSKRAGAGSELNEHQDSTYDELATSSRRKQEADADNSPRFPCPLAATFDCNKTFKRQKTATRHSHTHLEEYPCLCGKVFIRHDNLVAHFRCMHPKADIRRLKPRAKPRPAPRRGVQRGEASHKRKLSGDLDAAPSAQPPQKKARTADSSTTSHGSLDSGIAMAEDEHRNPSSSTKKVQAAKGPDRYTLREEDVGDSDQDNAASSCRICHMPFRTKRARAAHERNTAVHMYLEQCSTCQQRYHSHSALRQHQIDAGHHDPEDQVPKDSGHFTDQEEARLDKWRARFCHEHSLTDSEFNDLMTDTRKVRASGWPYEFISRRELLDAYYAVLPRRSRESLRRYRDNHFHNGEKDAAWGADIDEEIVQMYKTIGPKWTAIAEAVGRSWPSVRRRYFDTLQHGGELRKGPWSEDESKRFSEAVDQVQKSIHRSPGPAFNWTAVSDKMGTRTAQQCANRWRSLHDKLVGNQWRKSGPVLTSSPQRSRMEQRLSAASPSDLSPVFVVESDEEPGLNAAAEDTVAEDDAAAGNDAVADNDTASSDDQSGEEGEDRRSTSPMTDVVYDSNPGTQLGVAATEAPGAISDRGSDAEQNESMEIDDQPVANADAVVDANADANADADVDAVTEADLSGEESLPTSHLRVRTPRPSMALTQAFEETQAHTSAYRDPHDSHPSQDQPSPSIALEPRVQRSSPAMLKPIASGQPDFLSSIQESARSQKRRLEEFRRASQNYQRSLGGESD